MEQRFSDLLSDAFSETTVPSFTDEDLDFENLNFDEKFEVEKTANSQENLLTKEARALHQEATGESTFLSAMETKNIYMAENVDKEQSDDDDDHDDKDFQSVRVSLLSMDRISEENYTSSDGDSEQEGSVSREDEEDEEEDRGTREKQGDLLMSVCCGDEICYGNKEDRIFAEGQPLSQDGAENPQVRNEEQGESESDEEVSYFGRIPERGNEMMIKGDGVEEDEQEREENKQEDSSDSEDDGMKVEQEENVLAQCFEQEVENPYRSEPGTVTLDFPEISVQNLQDLIAEVDREKYVEKMKDFSGEEHQEAGESFADYPSDFSSCEYVEEGVKNQESICQSNTLPHTSGSNAKQTICLEGEVTDITWMGREEDTDEEGDGYLYSIDLEMDADRLMSFNVAAKEKDGEKCENVLSDAAVTGCDDEGETSESDSYSSSDDEVQERRRDEDFLDNTCLRDLEYYKTLEESRLHRADTSAFSRWSTSDDHHIHNNRADQADLSKSWDFNVSKTASILSEDLLTAEDTETPEASLSDVSQRPAENSNSYSVVQREDSKTPSPSYQGSLDDSFFFNTDVEASEVTEQGQLGDDEYEEDRNWEQEQERIKAFYKFYNDSDGENEREERRIKVQFCTDPLSQVIHYETDSSDRDSLSSSIDREEDVSSAETSEELREPDDNLQMSPAYDPPDIESVPESVPESMPESVPESMPESVPESVPETNVNNTKICTRKHKCLGMLKLTLKMGLVIGMGLLMFRMGTGQPDWLSLASFF